MTLLNQFFWIIYPYIMLTMFVVGHFYRYNKDQYGWSAKSSEILEKRILKWGSNLFHYGIIFAFFGHIAGIVVPGWIYPMLGVSDELYHLGAVGFGGFVGVIALIGIVILVIRRVNETRVRYQSSTMDWVVGFLLLIAIGEGVYVTVIRNIFVGGFDYRATINPWFRSLFSFTPNPTYMTAVPLSFQIHVLTGFLIFGLLPFTRLVHMWSLPLTYLKRSYLVYRSHNFFRTFQESKLKNK